MITCDDREITQHPEIPTFLPNCQIQRLVAGDYAFLDYKNDPVGIERCEVSNLMQKLESGELESQLRMAEELYTKFYLLTEGVWDKDKDGAVRSYKFVDMKLKGKKVPAYVHYRRHSFFQYNRLTSAIVRLEEMGLKILPTSPNFACSMELIKLLATKLAEPPEASKMFTSSRTMKLPTKLTKNPAVPMLMSLCPRLPETVAIKLIAEYGNIIGVLIAKDIKVDGFGKVLQERLRENVGLVTD